MCSKWQAWDEEVLVWSWVRDTHARFVVHWEFVAYTCWTESVQGEEESQSRWPGKWEKDQRDCIYWWWFVSASMESTTQLYKASHEGITTWLDWMREGPNSAKQQTATVNNTLIHVFSSCLVMLLKQLDKYTLVRMARAHQIIRL